VGSANARDAPLTSRYPPVPVSPETKIRAACTLIPIAIVIGAGAAAAGVWWTVAAMALLVMSQVVNLRTSQRKADGQPPSRFHG
jgi:hypothetical protein